MFKLTEKNQMKIFVAFLIICIAIIFATLVIGCSTKDAGNEVDLRLHDIWALGSINGEEFVKDELNNHPVIEIYLKEERIHGNAGCNTINGKVEVDGNKHFQISLQQKWLALEILSRDFFQQFKALMVIK